MNGLISLGVYIPRYRLQREAIAAALGTGGGRGSRSVASYDEDAASLGVEAARKALSGVGHRPERLYFATPAPPYLDKSNAAVIAAALGLDRSVFAADFGGAPRSGFGAMVAAAEADAPALALLSDLRTGRPGSSDESSGGDAAAALLFGPGTEEDPVIARVIAMAATTEEFLERWRAPGAQHSRTWEERFGEHVYGPLAEESFTAALKQANRTPSQVDRLLTSGLATRAVRQFARTSGVRAEAVAADRWNELGNCGTAELGVQLADALATAGPGELIALVLLADGATTVLLETTEHVTQRRPDPSVAAQVEAGAPISYATFLTWRGVLDREPPRRPEPDGPAAPPAHRSAAYKHSFQATRCTACGTVNVPPSRVCYSCSQIDEMAPAPLSTTLGTVVTFTVDRLAFTPSPPMIAVVVDFDGGGRFRCELADADPDEVHIGMRVEMSFRRLLTADGVHNYFWKAKPLRSSQTNSIEENA
ncbi:hydroxymethylglutaryl-CoA synthase family protein [Sporichthya brevicatena]|uniref:Hydroxymethylglutaryl-CoA synthase family protein n=1 Tax=Sporichthya brevicatena TaxID=171442 RepID=A0ABP3RKU2_9ACTN